MVKCCVDGCRSNSKFSTEDITFHRFPDVRCFPKLFLKWSQKVSGCLEAEAPEMVPQSSDRVCSLHFTVDDFAIRTDRNRTRKALRVEALPTQRLPTDRKSWGSELSELTITQVTGSYAGDELTSPDANGNTDTNGAQKLPTPDERAPINGGFGDKAHLPLKMARKKIKLEPKEFNRGAIKSTLERDELEALIQVKQSEITFHSHADSSQPQCNNDDNVEDASHIPPCFRAKKDLHSLFAFVVTPLELEEGFELMMINDNKYVKCNTLSSDSHLWRCILKNCAVRVITSSVHCSILVGLQGVHYHLPTKDLAVNPAAWKLAEPGWGMGPEPGQAGEEDPDVEVEEVSCEETPTQPPVKVPPWARDNGPWPRANGDSRFGVKDLLAPNTGRLQHPNIPSLQQSPVSPTENLQAAFASLTKYSGGQLIAAIDPFSALRFHGGGAFPNVSAVSSSAFPRPQSTDNGLGPHSTPSTTQQDEPEYVLQSPASERSNVIVDEASEGSCSNPEPLGSRLGEPLYQLVDEVDVQNIMQKDPLALEESNDADPKSDDQPTEGPGTSPLPPDFVPFFESLGPHLELLTPDLRQLFKAKVVLILSELCKKDPPSSET